MLRIDRGAQGPLPSRVRNKLASVLLEEGPKADVIMVSDYGAGVLCDETRAVLRSLANEGTDWEFAVNVLNALNKTNDDIAYFYTSRLSNEPAEGIDDIHFHPAEPRTMRVTATRRF